MLSFAFFHPSFNEDLTWEAFVSFSFMFAALCFGKILKIHLQLVSRRGERRISVLSSFGNLKIELLVSLWSAV